MLSQEKLLGLVGRIYDAAADEGLWPAFLEGFADVVDTTVTGLIHYDSERPRVNSAMFVRMHPEYTRSYVDYYSTVNPWIRSWKSRLNLDGPASVTVGEELVEPAELEKTEYYSDFLLPQDIYHQCAGMIVKPERWGCAFACLRPRGKGSFGASEVALVRVLLPHLRHAVQFQRRLAESEGAHRACLDALDSLPIGIILLDDKGLILEMNCEARQILSQGDGLAARKEGLAAATANQTSELRSAIARAALTAQGKGVAPGGSLGISRPSGKRPLSLVAMPVSMLAFSPDAREPAVIVFVSDSESKVKADPEVLARVFGLTGAESRLAEQLMRGETLVHAAERLGISHNTARTHLQRVYGKTGASHQGALVRLLVAGVTGLRPGHQA